MLAAWRPLEAIGVRNPAAWRQTEGWEGAFSIAKNAPRGRADLEGRGITELCARHRAASAAALPVQESPPPALGGSPEPAMCPWD